jgi:hypothetical protein
MPEPDVPLSSKEQIAEEVRKQLSRIERADQDAEELLRRRLTEDVRTAVKRELFATYATVGIVVGAVLAFLGWDFMREIRGEMRRLVTEDFETVRKDLEDDVDALKTNVAEQAGRINSESDRAKFVLGGVAEQLGKLELNNEMLRDINETVESLQEARRALVPEVEEIKARIATLDVIADQLQALAAAVPPEEPTAPAYVDVAAKLRTAQASADETIARPTVHLQFAGGTRAKAQELADALDASGFVVPGEERDPGAVGKREVRYFYAEDRESAQRLAGVVESASEAIGTGGTVTIVPLTDYSGKPKQGILELWIEI